MSEERAVGWRGWLLRVLAVGYTLALLAIILGLRFVGERWWVTTAALYLPLVGFALPWPFLTLAVLLSRRWWLLSTQLAAFVLLLFPLLGYHLPGRAQLPHEGATHLRVLTFNTAGGRFGFDALFAQIRSVDPDVVVLQELKDAEVETYRAALAGYDVRANGQFLVASRFPIAEVTEPGPMLHDGKQHSRHYAWFRLTTPAGPLRIYDLHTTSPRESLDQLRGTGLKDGLAHGRLFDQDGAVEVTKVAGLRSAQAAAAAEDAAQSPCPALIVGDTNLPDLSWARARHFGRFQDAFAAVGSGFGYTFPANKVPWMRIDRIMATGQIRFLSAGVVPGHGSDHLPVFADLELTTAPEPASPTKE